MIEFELLLLLLVLLMMIGKYLGSSGCCSSHPGFLMGWFLQVGWLGWSWLTA
jgi:hypothetical protein